MSRLTRDQELIEEAGLLDRTSVLMLPTGGGKTWLARRAIRNALERGLKGVYLSPLRAIARELSCEWAKEFADYKVGVYTGEVGLDDGQGVWSPAEADVLICTPEKFDLYLRMWSDNLGWLAKVGRVVVDELHTMGSGRRGATLEGLMTRMKCINPYAEVMGLSATLGNPGELAKWMGGEHYESKVRPIPLEWRIRTHSKNESKAELVVEEVQEVVEQGGQAIVFVQSRPRTESLVKRLKEAGIAAAAHHAGLPRRARERAESGYRAGEFGVLVATPTLAMGVNLPARRVVLHDLQRWEGGGWKDLGVNEVWQLAGRAGRPGLDAKGEVVLLAPVWNQKAARGYVAGKFEPIKSALSERQHFGEQLMVCFGSRMATRLDQAVRVMGKTLRAQSMTPGELTREVKGSVEEMVVAGMLERSDEGFIRGTRLGRVATRFQLTAKTVMGWRRLEEGVESAKLMDILVGVCASKDFTARLRVDHDEVEELQRALDSEPMDLAKMDEAARDLILGVSGKELVAAIKTACALRAWTRLGDIEEAATAVGALGHEIEEARMEAVRMLQAMRALLESKPRKVVDEGLFAEVGLMERCGALAAMVCAGLDDQEATLALIDGVGPVMARRLAKMGFKDVEDLALARVDEVAQTEGVSAKRAGKWIEEAAHLVHKGGAMRYREACAQEEVVRDAVQVIRGLDYYRWVRSQGLRTQPNKDGWLVSGGSEEHQVERSAGKYRCDCQDASKGRLCKHRIRVMHDEGEAGIPRYADGFRRAGKGVRLDLESEWSRGAMVMSSGWR